MFNSLKLKRELPPNSRGAKVARFSKGLYFFTLGFLILGGGLPIIGILFQFANRRYNGIPLGEEYGASKAYGRDTGTWLTKSAELFERVFITNKRNQKKTTPLEVMGLILNTIFPLTFAAFFLSSPLMIVLDPLLITALVLSFTSAPAFIVFAVFVLPPVIAAFGLLTIAALTTDMNLLTTDKQKTATAHPNAAPTASPQAEKDKVADKTPAAQQVQTPMYENSKQNVEKAQSSTSNETTQANMAPSDPMQKKLIPA